MGKKPTGRPSTYNEAVAEEICTQLVEGKSLAEICRQEGFPSYSTVVKWRNDIPSFSANYARAREDQADTDADTIGDIARKVAQGEMDPQAARVAIDAYKWTAGKRKPKVYGDKLAIGGAADLPPIQTVDATKLSSDALRELMAAKADPENE